MGSELLDSREGGDMKELFLKYKVFNKIFPLTFAQLKRRSYCPFIQSCLNNHMFRMKVFLFFLIVVFTPNTLVFGKPTEPSDPANFINAKVSDLGQNSIQHVEVIFLQA